MAKLKTGRHTSALKEARKSKRRREHNLQLKSKIISLKKQFSKLIVKKESEKLKELLQQFYKAVDKATKNNHIHKNKAARLKSKLSKVYNKIVGKS